MDLYQGCSLFDMMLDVMGRGIKEHRPLPFGTSCLQTERKLDKWRRAMEERGLKICRKNSEYLGGKLDILLQNSEWYREW